MKKYYYLVHMQYLGFRYHGWQKQPGVKTVESMLEKTTQYVLGHDRCRIMGTSRTDAMVSANHSAFELFSDTALNIETLRINFNENLPPDIRVLKIEPVPASFNIIQTPRIKEYVYLFTHGEKSHPFCASLLHTSQRHLDIAVMQKGARLFEGKHNFIRYCTKPRPGTTCRREVTVCKIEENTLFTASFFPKTTYACQIHARGFLRNQVRLIMGRLFCLGRGEISLDDITASLTGEDTRPLKDIAPASGLILNRVFFG